jgi:hypothetical protein
LNEYDNLLKQAKLEVNSALTSTAKKFIPKMYDALRNENPNITSKDARDRIEKDCVGIWGKRTILNALPDEAKDQKKQKAGRLRQKGVKSAAFSAAQSSEEKKKEITIDTQGRTIENETPSSTSLPSMSFVSNRDNEGGCASNNDYNKLENIDHLLHFEFALASDEISNYIFFSSDKNIWFNGTLDKISGKVITASIGRMSQYTPNESANGDES